MGNKCSACCKKKKPKKQLSHLQHKKAKDRFLRLQDYRVFTENHFSKKQDELNSNLQHISEREPDFEQEDPSLHPTLGM